MDKQEQVPELVEHLRASGSFAYDSEFIGELSYYPRLCLIQVATTQRVVLIDSLAELDLADFWALLADPSVEKIVHAGEQDLEPVHRHIGRPASNIFDTQIAAGFAGYAFPAGLSKLVKELIGVSLGKGFTFTHWDQRPLTAVQLRYAADDVRYLPALRAMIGQQIEQRGYMPFLKEESESLCDPSRLRFDPGGDYLRIRGVGALAPRNVAILRELAIWRDEAARRHDSPPRSYVKDEILLELARNPISALSDLDRVKGLPRPVEEDEGDQILQATQHALGLPEAQHPIILTGEESPRERFTVDSVWALIEAWCHGQGIDPALLSSRNEIGKFYRQYIENHDDCCNHRLFTGWRNQYLGQPLLTFLKGDATLQLNWSQNELIAAHQNHRTAP